MPGKILLCDDDPGIVESVKLILEFKGYEVMTLLDALDIPEVLATFSPDVILLDLWLSGVSGEEIARQLKSEIATKSIPIVILSANQQAAEIADRVGADACLGKPFDVAQLERIINPFCETEK